MSKRQRYSRDDLVRLQQLTRTEVLAVLGSFDEAVVDNDADLALRTAGLLDADRIPGLAAAVQAADGDAVAAAVLAACTGPLPAAPPPADGATMQRAADILAHRFTFYTETHQLDADIDWDHNPGTAHWGHDLNRFNYLAPLRAAYRTSHDVAYAREAAALILDWIAKCDKGRCFTGTPYVFGSYLNNAIHCSAWVDCLPTLLAAGVVDAQQLLRILKSLHDQLAYLEIVTHRHHGNWPTIGCQGMLQVLAAYPLMRDRDRFVDHCVETLAVQIAEQVLPDGVQDELTPHYHACVVGNLLTACGSLRALGRQLAPDTMETLRRMVGYQQQTVVPDGSAQVAFNDSDPEVVPDSAARLQRLGLGEYLRPATELGPELFPYGGVALLRQRATEGDLYLAFDGGPYGRSHQHEDMLGFWLHAYGRNFLVDPGRHLYDQSAVSYLPHLRSTQAHSTICVDGLGQNAKGRPDTWIAGAVLPMTFSEVPGEVRAAAAYDLGYGPDNTLAIVHQREIVFVAQRFWIVFDTVRGSGPDRGGQHRIESRFQYGPGPVELDGDGRALTRFADANLMLWTTADWDVVRVLEGCEEPRAGWYSASYSRIEPAPSVLLEHTTELPFCCATLLFPYRGTQPPDVTFACVDGVAVLRSRETGEVRVTATGPSQMWKT